jgi:hypothetical protein
MRKLFMAGAAVLALGIGSAQAQIIAPYEQVFSGNCKGTYIATQNVVPAGTTVVWGAHIHFNTVPAHGLTIAAAGVDDIGWITKMGGDMTESPPSWGGAFQGFSQTGIGYPPFGFSVKSTNTLDTSVACQEGDTYSGTTTFYLR